MAKKIKNFLLSPCYKLIALCGRLIVEGNLLYNALQIGVSLKVRPQNVAMKKGI